MPNKLESIRVNEMQELDLTGLSIVQITIREDGTVIWVNTEKGCVLRICGIDSLEIIDDRRKKNV